MFLFLALTLVFIGVHGLAILWPDLESDVFFAVILSDHFAYAWIAFMILVAMAHLEGEHE